MRRFILLAAPLAALFFTKGTASAIDESQAAATFLLKEPGAKQAGMGEAYSAVSDDATAGYYNPAGLAFQNSSRRDLQISRYQWLPELIDGMYYDYIGYSQYVSGWGHFSFNLASFYEVLPILNPLIPWSIVPWNRSNRFGMYDTMVSGSYGAPITENLALGITLKGIYSKRDYYLWLEDEKWKATGYTFALDFGTMYKPQIKGLTLSAVVHNLGPKIAYKSDYKDIHNAAPLPLNVVFGAAYIPIDDEFNRITFVLDIYKPLVMRNASPVEALVKGWYDEDNEFEQIDLKVGVEWIYLCYLALRTGYTYDKDGEVINRTVGCGIIIYGMSADVAYYYSPKYFFPKKSSAWDKWDNPMRDTWRFSIGGKF